MKSLIAMTALVLGLMPACTTSKRKDSSYSPYPGSVELKAIKGFTLSKPVVGFATVETMNNNRVFTVTFVDLNSKTTPPDQFQIMVFGDVKIGSQSAPGSNCDTTSPGLVGTCASAMINGKNEQLYGGFITVDKLPTANGQEFALSFELINGPEKLLKGSARGKTDAGNAVDVEPNN